MANDFLLKRNMRLFGLPYQFNDSVDPRVKEFSPTIGRKFAENIILDAPVISIIPGKPKYLGGDAKKKDTTTQLLLANASDNFAPFKQYIKDKAAKDGEFRYYDFERSYTEYMKYVNILCRSCASFLEIDELIDGHSCQRYDYRKYRWTTDSIHGGTTLERGLKSVWNAITGNKTVDVNLFNTSADDDPTSPVLRYTTTDTGYDEADSSIDELLTNYNYVQFFVDSDVSFNESMSNEASESQIKSSIINAGEDFLKEISFLMGTAGAESLGAGLQDAVGSVTAGLADITGNSALLEPLSRVLNLAGNVAKGENIIMPQIYQRSQYQKSYSFTVHLKAPYGSKFGYFMDICVPLMHLIGLGLPVQASANTYSAPFLIKAYCEGIFTCNMGMVESINVRKGVNNAYSVDGLPTEVDVEVSIVDLYSDLSMSPQSSPMLFANNSSLVEYLATTCGLSLITPNIKKRIDMLTNSIKNAIFDVDTNIISGISEAADNLFKDFFGLNSW